MFLNNNGFISRSSNNLEPPITERPDDDSMSSSTTKSNDKLEIAIKRVIPRKSKSAQKMLESKPRKSKIHKYRKVSIPNRIRKSKIKINKPRKVS